MGKKSNNNGRTYEYICMLSLHKAISKKTPASIIKNSSYFAAEKAWATLTKADKSIYTLSAKSIIETIFALEPNILESNKKTLKLYIQTDQKGQDADVRDIIIERPDIAWEIGLSIKHNHLAVKHSRLSKSLDFGEKWYGVKCSKTYWDDIKPVFDFLEKEHLKGTLFRNLRSKREIYQQVLNAFIKEIKKQIKKDKTISRTIVEYLLSKYDFYKVISLDDKRITTIQSFNIHGTLNRPSKKSRPKIVVPKIDLPNSLVHIGIKPRSTTTAIMIFDNGWQFSFRLHNAKESVEPSLKFDIRIVGMPAKINMVFNCIW